MTTMMSAAVVVGEGTTSTTTTSISHWSFQGSTALAIVVHEDDDRGDYGGSGSGRSIVVANVGDSRAVLCRAGRAMDLTRDHKPDDVLER